MQGQGGTTNTQDQPPTGRALDHGGRLAEARRLFPGAPEPFIDLSTGINPVPYPIGTLAPDLWTRLPEPDALDALQHAAALAYGLTDPAMVVAAPGTQILISLLPLLFPYRQTAVLAPTYNEHAASWRAAGATVLEANDLDAATAPCVVLCNPNNPDGRRTDPARLRALADRLAAQSGLLIVDEAFADFDPALSLAPALPHPAILLLRSFGKTYGLAGLRLGFALAAPALATRLRNALGPWAVSGPAAAIGRQALLDRDWLRAQTARLAQATASLDRLLTSAGLRIAGGTALFRLAESPAAPAWFTRLGNAGIFVRRFAHQPTRLRLGLPPNQPAWLQLEQALHATEGNRPEG